MNPEGQDEFMESLSEDLLIIVNKSAKKNAYITINGVPDFEDLAVYILCNPHDDEALSAFIRGVELGIITPHDRTHVEDAIRTLLYEKR